MRRLFQNKFKARVWGDMSLLACDGTFILPNGGKERAILATLLVSSGGRRSRRWLQALLWGDSPPDKAATNLRQSIARLRRSFAQTNGLLGTDHLSIWLDLDRVDVLPREGATEVLFEGLDIGEEPFEDWLLEQRRDADGALLEGEDEAAQPPAASPVHIARPIAPPSLPIVTLVRGPGIGPMDPEVVRIAASTRVRLSELELLDLREAIGTIRPSVGLEIVVERAPPDLTILSLRDAATGRVHWTSFCRATNEAPDEAAALVGCAVEALLHHMDDRLDSEQSHLSRLGHMGRVLDGLFNPGMHPIVDLRMRVDEAFQGQPSALHHALRNCIRMLEFGERLPGHDGIRREFVMDDLRRSLQLNPSNAMVHGLGCHTFSLFLKDHQAAVEHGKLAVSMAPDHPVCRAFLALAYLRAGCPDKALETVQRAEGMVGASRYRAFIEGVGAAVSACSGRFDATVRHGQNALLLAPGFRAVKEFLLLGYQQRGDIEHARKIAHSIRRAEPQYGRRMIMGRATAVNIDLARPLIADSADRLGFQ